MEPKTLVSADKIKDTGFSKITPFLWFDNQAEEAVNFYVSVFRNSRVNSVTRYGESAAKASGMEKGSVMVIGFQIEGQEFSALNGGPVFRHSPAISFVISCDTQEELDYYWDKLCEGGDENAQQCGWLQDKFGVSWQVVPAFWTKLVADADPETSERLMQVIMPMKKLDFKAIKKAYGQS